jgi:hypothetical protein
MADDAANEVVRPRSFQRDGGGATAIRAEGITQRATVVVASAHFFHGVSS